MVPVLSVLFALSAVLPIAGFGRLLLRSHRVVRELERMVAERGASHYTIGDLNRDMPDDVREPARAERRDLVWDICLVGVGLVAGAAASIWSLLLS